MGSHPQIAFRVDIKIVDSGACVNRKPGAQRPIGLVPFEDGNRPADSRSYIDSLPVGTNSDSVRISKARCRYLKTTTVVVEDVGPGQLEKVFHRHDGAVAACAQPGPYWT